MSVPGHLVGCSIESTEICSCTALATRTEEDVRAERSERRLRECAPELLTFARQVAGLLEYETDDDDAVSASDGEDAMESMNSLIVRARDILAKIEGQP